MLPRNPGTPILREATRLRQALKTYMATSAPASDPGRLRQGVLTAVLPDTTVEVSIEGDPVSVPATIAYVPGYTPAPGDLVMVTQQEDQGWAHVMHPINTPQLSAPPPVGLALPPPPFGLPAGIILPYAGSTAPTYAVLCNGQALDRGNYSALYEVIGTTYGVGNGSTTFGVPNLVGCFPVGVGTAKNGPTYNLGDTQIPGATHTHIAAGTTGDQNALHLHGVASIGMGSQNALHLHTQVVPGSGDTYTENAFHQHALSGSTDQENNYHTHTFTSGATTGQTAVPASAVNFIITVG